MTNRPHRQLLRSIVVWAFFGVLVCSQLGVGHAMELMVELEAACEDDCPCDAVVDEVVAAAGHADAAEERADHDHDGGDDGCPPSCDDCGCTCAAPGVALVPFSNKLFSRPTVAARAGPDSPLEREVVPPRRPPEASLV